MARKFANERLLGDLLPVLDSLEAGLAGRRDTAEHLREGMELTLRSCSRSPPTTAWSRSIRPGEPFNPDRHQAMSMVDSAGHAPGTSCRSSRRATLLNDRLLRPALVVVAQARLNARRALNGRPRAPR